MDSSLISRLLSHVVKGVRPFYLRWLLFAVKPQTRPPEWVRCWKYPCFDKYPASDLGEPSRQSRRSRDWIFLGMVDWHTRLQRTQQFAIASAAQGDRSFFLNVNLGRQYAESPMHDRPSKFGKLADGIWELHIPLPTEPVFHHGMLTPSEEELLCTTMFRMLADADVVNPAIVFSVPVWTETARRLKERFSGTLIYDCHDWIAGLPNMARTIADREPDSIAEADLVVFSNDTLLRHYAGIIPQVLEKNVVIRNGVPEWPGTKTVKPAIQTIGFVGGFEPWVDWILIDRVAEAFPTVEVVIAGSGSYRPPPTLQSRPNVHFLGEIRNTDLPGLLPQFTVAIVPFRECDAVTFADPIKVYEYFWYGLPVVYKSLTLDIEIADLAYAASSEDDFVRNVATALQEKSDELAQSRKDLARRSTWNLRLKSIAQAVDELIVGTKTKLCVSKLSPYNPNQLKM